MTTEGPSVQNVRSVGITLGALFIAPSLVSLFLMRVAGAGVAQLLIQGASLVLAMGVVGITVSVTRRNPWHCMPAAPGWRLPLLMSACVVVVLLPVLMPHSMPPPHRWLTLGSLQIYAPSLALPSLLLLTSSARTSKNGFAAFAALVLASVGVALMPDAPQATAWSVGLLTSLVIQRPAPVAFESVTQRLGPPVAFTASALCAAWAHTQPDPFRPVQYVEGVFSLGFAQSIATGLVVLAVAIGIVGALRWHAVRTLPALWPVATYFGALLAQAALYQSTPAPVVGFGASPILGLATAMALAQWLASSRER